MVQEWILDRAGLSFTPDSRTLVTCRGDGLDFRDVASFQSVRRLHGEGDDALRQIAFSPGGKLWAVSLNQTQILLLDAASTRIVARLTDPHGERVDWIGFNSDGTQLLTTSNTAKAIHAWDLRAIRARLKAMGLDRDWPEFPARGEPGNVSSRSADPVRRIEVIGDVENLQHRMKQQ
jgi:WD40 repeat protein